MAVPNVSFAIYKPSFLEKFFEAHMVQFQGNAGLKPKEGEVTSRPWQWPIDYQVSEEGGGSPGHEAGKGCVWRAMNIHRVAFGETFYDDVFQCGLSCAKEASKNLQNNF